MTLLTQLRWCLRQTFMLEVFVLLVVATLAVVIENVETYLEID